MRALNRKLLRDWAQLPAQAVAIALVVASGVALFVAMFATYRTLKSTEHQYYSERRFAHVWASLSRAPRSLTRQVAAILGARAVEGRIEQHAILDVPGLDEPASAQVVSMPSESSHAVNDLYLRRGRHPAPGQRGEVLVSEAFAEANQLSLGSPLTAVLAGQRVLLRPVGVALSPEYVMPIPPSGLAPDDRRFAVLWMARDELEILSGLPGAINEVSVLLAPHTDERAFTAELDRLLEPYGGRGAYGRSSQPSHTMLEEHIQPLKSLALLLPAIFLLVAAFLINVVLSRRVAMERTQMGLLKAFGYGSLRVAAHYVELSLLLVVPGVVLGLPLGAWLGHGFAEFYARFFRFPALLFRVEPAVLASVSLIAILSGVLGAAGSARRALATPPSVAMAREIPNFRRWPLDGPIGRALGSSARMAVRNLWRHPTRALLSLAGMSLALAVVVLGNSVADSSARMRDVRYQLEERADVTVSLLHPRALGTARDFLSLPGVRAAEPFRAVPARLIVPGQARDVKLFGLPAAGLLRRPAENSGRVLSVPPAGALLTSAVARDFGLRPGDALQLEIRENRRRVVTTRLVELVDEPLGAAVYMDLSALGVLLGEPATYSAVNLLVDPTRARELNAQLKRTPAALGVDYRSGALASYRSMSDGVMDFVRKIDVLFSVIIAVGVVYNSVQIALAERARELATLRVLGFTRAEVSRALLAELALLALLAVPLGFGLGYWLSGLTLIAARGERMHFPLLVSPATYGFALVVFASAAAASASLVRRTVARFDLVAVLKERE